MGNNSEQLSLIDVEPDTRCQDVRDLLKERFGKEKKRKATVQEIIQIADKFKVGGGFVKKEYVKLLGKNE